MFKIYMMLANKKRYIGKADFVKDVLSIIDEWVEAHNIPVMGFKDELNIPKKILGYGSNPADYDFEGGEFTLPYDIPVWDIKRVDIPNKTVSYSVCERYAFVRHKLSTGINIRQNCDVVSVPTAKSIKFKWVWD